MGDHHTEINIVEMDASAVSISKPKKLDNSLFAKAKYNNARLYAYVYRTNVVMHKFPSGYGYSVLHVRAPPNVVGKFADLDAHIVNSVIANTHVWFHKGMDPGVIDEYYSPSVTVSGGSGTLIKIKLQCNMDPLIEGCYDLLLALKGVRFFKQRFVPEWELVAANMVDDCFLEGDDDESEGKGVESGCDEDDIVPWEELHQMRLQIEKELDEAVVELTFKKRDVKRAISAIARMRKELLPIATPGSIDKLQEQLTEVKNNLWRP